MLEKSLKKLLLEYLQFLLDRLSNIFFSINFFSPTFINEFFSSKLRIKIVNSHQYRFVSVRSGKHRFAFHKILIST